MTTQKAFSRREPADSLGMLPGVIALAAAGFGAVQTTVNAPRRVTQAHSAANAYLAIQTADIPSSLAFRRGQKNIEKGGQTYEVDKG